MLAVVVQCRTAPRSQLSSGSCAPSVGSLNGKLRRIETAREALAGREDEDEVLVRNTPGPIVEIFHAATDYCGRVSAEAIRRGKYDRLFISEALDRELRPCSACATHLVRRRRRPTSGAA
jgi:hypothetical protein